ncbi:MAG: bifunctional riboflavin kinase/FAD synthetase [Alphaproteobacteria bacterium]|nr:bifunctional riboflavin kinase/FAD synthetase [Alphaproteobacteria bacterium]
MLKKTPDEVKNSVIAIGNFDGVHLGHQALLSCAKEISVNSGCSLGALTFEPHPRQLFRPDEPPQRITPKDLKVFRLERSGVDYVFSLPFDWDFASQSAENFVQNILIDGLAASHVVIGSDFRFGQLRQGCAQTIEKAGIPVTVLDKVKSADKEISSSLIRQALRQGDIDVANEMLGWSWEIRGEIFRGDQRGRELGYPTANMELKDTVHPAYGVYAVLARLEGEEEWHMGATNIGIRPMFAVPMAQVETYIFDFDKEIYGQTLCVRPVKRLRGEAKFDSLEALIDQMARDCEQAREILKGLV